MVAHCPSCKGLVTRRDTLSWWHTLSGLTFLYPYGCGRCGARYSRSAYGRLLVSPRRHIRLATRIPAAFFNADIKGSGMLTDISVSGCAIETKHPVPIDTQLRLQLSARGLSDLLVSAAVIRSEPDHGFSVSFIESERGQVNTFLSALWRMQQQKVSTAAGTEVHAARLYVCGVPPQLNDQRLEELFARYGSLQKLRLVKTVQGLIAQVDMLSSDEARHARMALDQLKLHGAILEVVPAESEKGRELRSLLESSGPETFRLQLR